MHIITTIKEYSSNEPLLAKLPVGTTVVICEDDDEQKPLRRMLLTDSGFEVDMDFVEHERDWESEEIEKEYAAQQTRESVVRFFVEHDEYGDPQPYRYFDTMSGLEYNFLKYVRDNGYSLPPESDPKLEHPYNLFRISIGKDDRLEAVMAELILVMEIQANRHPNINWHHFSIFEHTLSRYASYSLLFKNNKWQIEATRYGRAEAEYTHDELENCLQYIQKNLWYGDDEDDAYDDD